MKQLFHLQTIKLLAAFFTLVLSVSGTLVHAQEQLKSEMLSLDLAQEQVMDLDQLEVRDELRFAPEQQQPFTGNAVSYYGDGMQKLQVSFNAGRKNGKEVAWYEDGQLRYVVRYLDGEPQSQGSSWYARTSQTKVAMAVLRFCDEEDMTIGFCDPGVQESSRIEFTP